METETQVSVEVFLPAPLPPWPHPAVKPVPWGQVLDALFSMEKKLGKGQKVSSTRMASSGPGHTARAVPRTKQTVFLEMLEVIVVRNACYNDLSLE